MQQLGSVQSVCACMSALMQGGLGGRPASLQTPLEQGTESQAPPQLNGEHEAADSEAAGQDDGAAADGKPHEAEPQAALLPLKVRGGLVTKTVQLLVLVMLQSQAWFDPFGCRPKAVLQAPAELGP